LSDHQQYGSPYIKGGGGWGILNGILGWQNSATYGSVISYNVYWISIIVLFLSMRYNEVRGHWPMMGGKKIAAETGPQDFVISGTASDCAGNGIVDNGTRAKTAAKIRTIDL
jgi:high-affinity iron transporter